MIHLDVEKKMLTSEGQRTMEVTVDIPDQSLTCVSGFSGIGKTTLIRMIAGLEKPDRGVIRVGERVLFDSARKINLLPQRRSVGYMFQDYALFPNMNVVQNITFAQSSDGKDPQLVDMLINTFGLEALQKQKVTKLSGGQKQRVALARALAAKPSILLLDEPLSAIDHEMRWALQQEIVKAHRMFGSTTLMISHDRDEIARLATHELHITKGKVNSVEVVCAGDFSLHT
jgi:molybdate transport system ATP-binding protein